MHENEMKIEWSSMTTALPFELTQLQPFSAFAPVVELWSAMEENIIGLGIIVRNTDGGVYRRIVQKSHYFLQEYHTWNMKIQLVSNDRLFLLFFMLLNVITLVIIINSFSAIITVSTMIISIKISMDHKNILDSL